MDLNIPKKYIHMENLLRNVADLKDLCDVVLVVGIDKQKFPAHRVILMASSRYFAALLGPNFREGRESEIPLPSTDGLMMKTILEYIYTGAIEINEENVFDIVAAASGIELISLMDRCVGFMASRLSIKNCVDIFLNADVYGLDDIRWKSLKFICDHFEAVPFGDLLQLDERYLRELFGNDRVSAAETVIFNRFAQWVQQNRHDAVELNPELLTLIRLEHIPDSFLIGRVDPFFEKYGCENIVKSELCRRISNPKTICSHRFIAKQIYCALLNDALDGINIIKYDFDKNHWNEFRNNLFGRITAPYGIGYTFLNDVLYVMGGQTTRFNVINNVVSYNINDSTETILPPMRTSRALFTPICLAKYIYVFGGFDLRSHISACERFDTENRLWQPCRRLPIGLGQYAAIEFNGKIYVAGPNRFLCYDPISDEWSDKARTVAGTDVKFAKSKDHLYAINSNDIVSRYYANQDRWTTIGNFANFEYSRILGTINYRNQMYILCPRGEHQVLKMANNRTFIRLESIPGMDQSIVGVHLFLK